MRPLTFLLPVLYALFLWWFTTGLIIVVYGRSARTVRLWFLGATVGLAIALWGLLVTRGRTEPHHVYLAVTSGLAIWGWQTASYYLGFITGPAAQHPIWQPGPAGAGSWQSFVFRLRRAVRASLYHELVAAGFFLLLAGLTRSHPNRWGFWIFTAVWLMHLSAKLNVFLGVRNFRIEFLPPHLHHLEPLLDKRPHNAMLPVSVILAGTILLTLVYRAIVPGTPPADTAGYLLVATMMALGVLEHLLLVLPIPATLWGWRLRALPEAVVPENKARPEPRSHAIRALPKRMSES